MCHAMCYEPTLLGRRDADFVGHDTLCKIPVQDYEGDRECRRLGHLIDMGRALVKARRPVAELPMPPEAFPDALVGEGALEPGAGRGEGGGRPDMRRRRRYPHTQGGVPRRVSAVGDGQTDNVSPRGRVAVLRVLLGAGLAVAEVPVVGLDVAVGVGDGLCVVYG
jgi:hypothetical protein